MRLKSDPIITICGKAVRISGGLVRLARLDGEKYVFPSDPLEFVDALKRSDVRLDLFTFLQGPHDTTPIYPYRVETDNLAVLPISTFDHWWTKQIRSYPRNRARQAEKRGVILRELPFGDELLKGICDVYNESPVRQGKRFPYYGMTLDQARSYAATFLDRSIYAGAFLDGQMIGFIKLVTSDNNRHACLVHILSMMQHKDKAPTNALIAYAVRLCAARGLQYLVYERFSYGNKAGDSLSHFKEVNGFQRVDVPRYYVPLTLLGAASLRLGLHRRPTDYVPESLLSRLRDLRRLWYERTLPTASEI